MSTIADIIKDLDWCFERTGNEGYHLISYKDWQTLRAAVLAQQPNNAARDAMQCISKLLTLYKDDHEFVRGIRPIVENWSTAQHP